MMIVLADLLRRKDMKETVTQIDDGRSARTLVIMTAARPQTRYLDTEAHHAHATEPCLVW